MRLGFSHLSLADYVVTQSAINNASEVYLSKNDFTQLFNDCYEQSTIRSHDDNWFTIIGNCFVVYLDKNEEDLEI